MKLLSEEKYTGFSSAIEIINSATTLEQFVRNSFLAVENIIPCDIINYTEINAPANLLVWKSNIVSPGSNGIDLLSQYIFEHPSVAYHFSTGKIKSLKISDFISQRQFHTSKLYNEVYRLIGGTEYELGTPVWLDETCLNSLVLGRSLRDFFEAERLKLDHIRPYLMQAYAKVQIFELMKRLTQSYPEGLVIVNWKGDVVIASDSVWQMISKYFNSSLSYRSLPDIVNKWISHERSYFYKELNTTYLSTPLVVNNSSRKLALHFLWGSTQYNLLLVEENAIELDSELSHESSSLTNREKQILAHLCEGKTNAEIGLSLSISPLTVKKHLDSIYKKLQVHRRSAAIAKLLHRIPIKN